MGIAVVLGIIFFALFLGGVVGGMFFGVIKKRNANKTKGAIFGAVGGVFFVLFLLIPFSFHTVDAGEVAVVKHLGEAREIRTAGTYFDFWLTEKYQMYDAKVQNLSIVTTAYSKDAQTMDVNMTVQYQIDSSKAIDIANHYGSLDILGNRIESVSIEKAKSVLSSKSAMEIIETRASVSPEVEGVIKDSINSNYYVNIVAVVLTNIDFTDAFEKTVEDKMIAEQEKLKAEYEKETAIVNAEKELEVAKKQAEAKIEMAKADAASQIAIAEAEATAMQLKSVEIARMLGFDIIETDVKDENGIVTATNYEIDFTTASIPEAERTERVKLIVDYLKYTEYLAKWDGKLPNVYVSDGSASVIIPTQPQA